MALKVVKAGEVEAAGLNRAALDRLQWEQFQHDEKYHREIARLTVQDRLKHMALHFAKYAGQLVSVRGDKARTERLVTDVFIIAMSSANVLNMRLSDRFSACAVHGDVDFAEAVVTNAGRMAAACEKMDHLEDYPFRPEIAEAVVQLASEAVSYSQSQGWDLESMVHERLQPVKEKSIFYGLI